jgi:hypothetical protein
MHLALEVNPDQILVARLVSVGEWHLWMRYE